MKPDILVLTPTLGNRKSIEKTVASVKSIGGERVKHIIIAPQKQVADLKAQFSELEILAEPDNAKGIYPALNYGFRKYAKDYKYMTFINDDDYWLSKFLKLFEILDTDNSIDIVYGKVNYVDEKGEIIGEQTSSSRYKSFKALLKSNIVLFTQQATLMRSEVFLKQNGFDENYKLIADTNFWMQVIDSGSKLKYTNTICAAYTLQTNQLSSNKDLQKQEHQYLFERNGNPDIFITIVEKLIFRISNIKLYIKRLLDF